MWSHLFDKSESIIENAEKLATILLLCCDVALCVVVFHYCFTGLWLVLAVALCMFSVVI